MKHTPGPWETEVINNGLYNGAYQVWNQEGNEPKDSEEKPNARLIAVAPDLLEVLIMAKETIEGFPRSLDYNTTDIRIIDAVIAKATGDDS